MTPKQWEKVLRLKEALREAAIFALDNDPGQDNDGGSSNFDVPYINIKLSKKELTEYRRIGTVSVAETKKKNKLYIHSPLFGQGLRRTIMAEAAVKFLKEKGYDAHVEYRTD